MRSTIGFAVFTCVLALACSSKNSDNDGAGGSAGAGPAGRAIWDEYCSALVGAQTCPAATQYGECVVAQCDAQYKAAYGDGYAAGSFDGPCAQYASCVVGCPCDATYNTCRIDCRNAAPTTCLTALQSAENCLQSAGCLPGVCSSPDAGASSYTCQNLYDECCWQVGETKKQNSCYSFAAKADDQACAAAYGSLQLDSLCP
jgi:hypothetical protein